MKCKGCGQIGEKDNTLGLHDTQWWHDHCWQGYRFARIDACLIAIRDASRELTRLGYDDSLPSSVDYWIKQEQRLMPPKPLDK